MNQREKANQLRFDANRVFSAVKERKKNFHLHSDGVLRFFD